MSEAVYTKQDLPIINKLGYGKVLDFIGVPYQSGQATTK